MKKRIPYTYEKDGKLRVRVPYRSREGKWRCKEKVVDNQAGAIATIAEIKKQLGLAGPSAFEGEKMTVGELCAEYKKAYPNKPRWYIQPILDYFGESRRIRTITFGDMREFKAARQAVRKEIWRRTKEGRVLEVSDRRPATINRELEQARAIFLFAVGHGWLARNPMKHTPGSDPLIDKTAEDRRERIPTPEEERRLLAVCVSPREHLRGLIIATRDTGLRRSALQALIWGEHIDLENRLIRPPKGKRQKRRPKMIAMTARLHAELLRIWEARPDPAGRPFGDRQDFKRSYATACRLAGVTGLRFNDLRHGFATDMMEAGIPTALAMKAAGHSNEDIHDIYTNVDERIAREIAAALDRLHRSRGPEPELNPTDNEGSGFVN